MNQLPGELKQILSRSKTDPVIFAEKLLGITLHEGQKTYCRNRKKVNVLSPANRFGKTTLLSVLHIWYAWTKRGVRQGDMESWVNAEYLTCALAPHSQQAEVVIRTIRQILTSTYPVLDNYGKLTTNKCLIEWFLTRANETAPMQVEYANNAKTLVRSTGEDRGKSIAAKAFAYIGYDEAGKSLHLEEEYKSTLLPRTADLDGDIDLVGTPDAESPSFIFFQEMFWRGGGDNYPQEELHYSQEGSAAENPYLPAGYVEDMKKKYPPGDPYLEQVLYGKFISVGDKVFDHQTILKCAKDYLDDEETIPFPEYTPFESGHRYIMAIDSAIGNDDLVITVLDWTTLPSKIVRLSGKKGNSQSPSLHLQDAIDIFEHYDQERTCSIILETFNGESLRYYYDFPEKMRVKTRCFGSGRPIGLIKKQGMVDRKEDLLLAGRKVLDNQDIIFSARYRKLIQQLANYTLKDDKIKTDYTISFCLACFYATDGQPKNKVLTPKYVTW